MLTEEEKQELESLRDKESLTDEEKARVAELEAKEEPLDDEDEFDKAFDEAMGTKKPEPSSEKQEQTEDEGEEEEGEYKQTTDQSSEGEDDQQDGDIFNNAPEDDGSETDSGDGDEPTTEQKIANLEAELAREKQRTSSWEGRIRAANRRAEEAEAKLKELGKQDKEPKDLPVGDNDEDVVLGEFIEEFPSLEKPIKLLATKIARDIVDREIGEIKPTITQVQETVKSQAEQEHLAKIRQAHPDFIDIYASGALVSWIERQPKFMQPGLQRVVAEGSADEVIELYDTYKRSVGQSRKVVNKGNKQSKKKAKNLEAVTHSSSGPPADKKQAARDDFDGAWEEAVSKE